MNQQQKPDWFWHLTLNTGHTRKLYRSEVSDEALASMRQMGCLGPEADLMPGYRLKSVMEQDGAVFTVFCGDARLISGLLATSAESEEQYWAAAEKLYLDSTDRMPVDWVAPEKPASVPWLAVVLLPGIALHPAAADWLGDFERCMAWAVA